jgi:arylsulfatase A-like enzyme
MAAIAGSGASSSDAQARGSDGNRNVLVVMTDDERVEDMKAMRRTRRRIGGQGVRFANSYASFPVCCPSRATYLTGQYAHNHGVVSNHPPNGGAEALDDSATTAVALDAAGYRTGWVGKYLNGYLPLARQDPPYVPPGWDWWRATSVPRVMYGWEQVIGDRLKRWGFSDRDYQTDVYARQAVQFLENAAAEDAPFFLTISTFAPHIETRPSGGDHNPRGARRHRHVFDHEPLPRPPSFNEADVSDKPVFIQSRPRFDAEGRDKLRRINRDRLSTLLAVDELVLKVITTLRRSGVLDDTLVIFTSDNGYMLGDHRLKGKGYLYEGSARVPLMMRGPGVPNGRVVRSQASNVDLAATIYDFTGVAPLIPSDGTSLIDIAGAPTAFADRALLLENRVAQAIRTPDWFYAELHTSSGGAEFELYDMNADPDQLESLHTDPGHGAIRNQLANRLHAIDDCEGNECP